VIPWDDGPTIVVHNAAQASSAVQPLFATWILKIEWVEETKRKDNSYGFD